MTDNGANGRLSVADQILADIERDLIPINTLSLSNERSLPEWRDMADAVASPAALPVELIPGLLHQGAKLVLGGASKSNKTWCLLDLAISVATGSAWWSLPTIQGRVLYLNMEIHDAFFDRRAVAVLEAKQLALKKDAFVAWGLRGHSCDIGKLSTLILPQIVEGAFSLIVLDPIYKCLGDRDENKAGEIASLLNQIERIAVESGAAVAFGAHYSKGNQSAKESIDRIGGSGVFARDPDAILTLTRHEEDNAFVCEPVLRNHAPHDPFVLRWEYPLMRRDDTADPTALKQAVGRPATWGTNDLVELLDGKELTSKEFASLAQEEKGISPTTFYRILAKARQEKKVAKSKITGSFFKV